MKIDWKVFYYCYLNNTDYYNNFEINSNRHFTNVKENFLTYFQ